MKYPTTTLREYLKAVNAGINPAYLDLGFNAEQFKEMRIGLEHGININVYTNPEISATKMRTARLLQEMGTQVKPDLLQNYNERQLEEIRLGKKFGIDTTPYQNPKMDANDMRIVRLLATAQKIVESIKFKANEVFTGIKLRLNPTLINQQFDSVVQNELEKETFKTIQIIDIDQFNNLDELRDHVLQSLDLDATQENVSKNLEEQKAQELKEAEQKYSVIDHAEIKGESLALIQDENEYLVVKNFVGETLSWSEEMRFENKEAAAEQYQNYIVTKLYDRQVIVNEVEPKLSEADQKIADAIDKIADDMKVSDVKKVESYLALKEGFTLEDKLYAYQHADQISYHPYPEDTKNFNTLNARFAQAYLANANLLETMKTSGVYECVDLDEYGKQLLEKTHVVLDQEGYYEIQDKVVVKQEIKNEQTPQATKQLKLNCSSLSTLESRFNKAVENYMEMKMTENIHANLTIGGKQVLKTNFTSQAFKDLHDKATLQQSSAFKEMLQEKGISYDSLNEQFQEVNQPVEVPEIPIS